MNKVSKSESTRIVDAPKFPSAEKFLFYKDVDEKTIIFESRYNYLYPDGFYFCPTRVLEGVLFLKRKRDRRLR